MITEIDYKDLVAKNNVEMLEAKMLDLPQVSCPVEHKFGPGIYMREVSLPKGAIVMGHYQNFEHSCVFIKGRMTLFQEDGTRKEISAPLTFVSPPGRKVAYIHEDSLFMNVYSTNETNVENLENYYLTKSETSLKDKERALLLSSKSDNDYELFLKEFNLTEETVRKMSEDISDMTYLPFGNYKIKTGKSSIEGTGLFATADIKSGEIIGPARREGRRTIAGRYTNHSKNPNAKMVQGPLDSIYLVAIKDIIGCMGGRDGEEITVNYRDALKLTLQIGDEKCQQ